MTEMETEDQISKANEGEAALVVVHVKQLIATGLKPEDIAVITPYNLQVFNDTGLALKNPVLIRLLLLG